MCWTCSDTEVAWILPLPKVAYIICAALAEALENLAVETYSINKFTYKQDSSPKK